MKVQCAHDEDISFYKVIRDVLIAHLQQNPPKMCVEVARQSIPSGLRPDFQELDTEISQIAVAK